MSRLDRNYLTSLIVEVLQEDDGYLQKLFALVASGNVEQAFDLADSLDMEKELIQRIVNDKNNEEFEYGMTHEVSDENTVKMVEYAIGRPELEDRLKEFFVNSNLTVPTSYNAKKGSWDIVPDYDIYRKGAFLVFANILKRYDEFNGLNEEKFGRETQGDGILQEGWTDQWPGELQGISDAIQDVVPEPFQESVASIFYRTANIKELDPMRIVREVANRIKINVRSGIEFRAKQIRAYEQQIEKIEASPSIDFPQEEKDEDIAEIREEIAKIKKSIEKFEAFGALADDPFYFGTERRKTVLQQGRAIGDANPTTNLPLMRYTNKVIKSLKKQLQKWREKNTDPDSRINDYVGQSLDHLNRFLEYTTESVFSRFEEDMNRLFFFLKSVRGTGQDLAQKLASLIKKNKDLPMDEYIEQINKFTLQNNQDYFKDCDDATEGDPCVFLKLDNGMFWHSTETDYCEITQVEMNNCGAASESGSILYNLMSIGEGGGQKYHVTLEYNEEKNEVVQVLGQANSLPKEKYWSSIAAFFEAMENPLLNKDAFQHLRDEDEGANEDLDEDIKEFIEGIGARTEQPPATESWEAMSGQIRDGYYSELIQTVAPINNKENVFKASLSYAGMSGTDSRITTRANVILTLQVILQTKEPSKASTLSKDSPDLFRKGREFGESQEFKKILYEAVPEYFAKADRLDIKYSNIVGPRLRIGASGDYKMKMNLLFKVDIRGWSEAKGLMLANRFEKLLQTTIRDLPGQAMLVFLAVEGKGKTNEGKKKMKLDRNYLTSLVTEVVKESLSGMFSTVTNANQALNLYIDAGMLPKPAKMEVNEQWGSIYIKFNSNEELQQLIDILDEDGVTQQLGTSAQKPAYFVHKALVNKRKQFYQSDEEIPEPPPPTGLTLKF